MSLPPFQHVVTEHGDAVLRVCRALLERNDAEDAWSETFLAALVAYPALPAGSNVRGWLVTIAHHKSVDLLRRGSRSRPTDRLPERATAPLDGAVVDEGLFAALRALPPKQRLAVTYHHVADLPYAQVGELLGTSEAAARRSAADGIASLRRTLGKKDPS